MMRVLVTHSYFYKLDRKQWRFKQPYPPLGTLLAAAVVRESGFETSFFDVALSEGPDQIMPSLETKPDILVIYDDGFNYLTKMCLTTMREAAFKMISFAKAKNALVIVCNSDSSDHYEKYLAKGVDYVIRGEGEETLTELLLSLKEGKDTDKIQGIAYLKNPEAIANPARPVLKNLDSLPMPAWDLIDVEAYRKIWTKHHGYFSLNIATTRGCPYKCNWCAKPIYGNRYNSRSPEHVVNEIEYLLKEYQPDHFWMSDDIFGLKPYWIKRFSELVQQKNLKFNYKIQSRVDLLLEENTIDYLAASGAETVWVGAESGSQKILDAMDKGTTIEQIATATVKLKSKGIKVGYFLQLGYLGEKKADIDETIAMTLQNMPDEIGISVSYPLPGTKFFEKVKTELKEKQNWTDSDDLAMMYQATYLPTFYRHLHAYIHHRYRVKRSWMAIKKLVFRPHAIELKTVKRSAALIYHAFSCLIKKQRLNTLIANGTRI